MNAYELKQALRKSRQADSAAALQASADQLFALARESIEHIPFGQPILVGHHSERRHRRDLARHDRLMRKAIDTQNRARELAGRAATVSHAISADDPDAPDKLRERIAKLERDQEAMKAANKIVRSKIGAEGKVQQMVALGLSERGARAALVPDYAGRVGFPAYALTNNGANIRRLQERLAQIEDRPTESAPDVVGDGFTIREDMADNRVLILFAAIPSKEKRAELKSHGFKWSPNRGAWVRQHSEATRFWARRVCGVPTL